MDEESLDVKTEAASSAASDVKPGTESSSVSTTAEGDVKEQTLADATQAAFDASSSDAKDKVDGEEGKAASDVQSLNKTDEKAKPEGEVEDEEDSSDEEDKVVEKHEEAVPYERFQEVNQKREAAEQEALKYKPDAEAYKTVTDFCTSNNITVEQFQQGLQILAAINTDPAKALSLLQPTMEQLQGFTGDRIPQDLQAEVDEGNLSLERAKEITKLRNQTQFGERRQQMTVEQMNRQREQEFIQRTQKSLQSWGETRSKQDPDFVPKAKDATDGKFEFFRDRFKLLVMEKPPKSEQEAIGLAEQAYKDVSASFQRLAPKGKPSRVLSTSRSSSLGKHEPTTMAEAVLAAAAEHGISE